MNYFRNHELNIKEKIPFWASQLEKGMIVDVIYRAEKRQKTPKRYILLILNRNFEKKVHCLDLSQFSEEIFNDLAEQTGLVYIPNLARFRRLNFPKLIMEVSSRRFYYRKLKKKMNTIYNRSYRTMFVSNFSNIRLIDYKFEDRVEKKFLLEQKEYESKFPFRKK